MKLVIDIPDAYMKGVKIENGSLVSKKILDAVYSGTPLPKGHGALKDTDAICKDIISALGIRDENYLLDAEKAMYKRIKNAPVIIEADKEGGQG